MNLNKKCRNHQKYMLGKSGCKFCWDAKLTNDYLQKSSNLKPEEKLLISIFGNWEGKWKRHVRFT